MALQGKAELVVGSLWRCTCTVKDLLPSDKVLRISGNGGELDDGGRMLRTSALWPCGMNREYSGRPIGRRVNAVGCRRGRH